MIHPSCRTFDEVFYGLMEDYKRDGAAGVYSTISLAFAL